MNFDNPETMPKICYILEHDHIKSNTMMSVINIIEGIIENRLSKDPLHNIEDLSLIHI